MKASELMIGDWVFDGDEVERVTSLTCDGIIETTRRISNIEIVSPILLTAEILEKNGFKNGELNVSPQYFFEDGHIFIGVTLKATPDRREGVMLCKNNNSLQYEGKIEFVHELQHALRLCGIDKEIVV